MTTNNTNSPNIRPGFNGQGILDLNKLNSLTPHQFRDAKFSRFKFVDLNTIDTESENFLNVGVREEFDIDDRIERYQVSFRNLGFLLSEWPPCCDTDGEWLEGRGRIVSAKKNGEQWMPVAVYTRTDSSLKNTVTNGLTANFHIPQHSTTFRDFVEAGVHLITSKQLTNSKTDIDNWLYHEVEIERIFNNSNGRITKIRDSIIERANRDDSLILRRSLAEWHAWIKTNLALARSQYVLVSCDDKTRAERLWCRHILPAIMEKRAPVNIIYYTSSYSPKDSRAGLKESIAYLEELYSASFELVNSQIDGVTLTSPKKRPYNILGAVPQIVKSHNVVGHNLVNVSNY